MQASRAGTTHSPGDVGALACRGYKHRCNNSCSICWSSFIPPRAFFLLLRRSFDDFLVLSCFDLVFFFLSTPPVGLRAAVACHRSSPSAPYWKKLYHHTAGSTMNTTPPGISFFVDPDDRLSPTSFQADSVSPFGSDPSSRHAFSSLQSSPHIYQSGQAHSDTSEQQLGVTNEGSHPYPVNMSHRYLDLILQSPDIARHRDAACRYLDLTQELWVALYQPRRSSAAQRALTRHLERLYGTLPAGLWQSVLTVRSDPRFESFQGFLVTAVARIPVSQAHSRSGSDASGHWEMLPGASADARSLHPRQARSQPGSRSPTSRGRRNMRGRAPAGYKYFCPEPGCSHRPFRNAGNYLIHLDRFHPDYPEHDPTDKLRLVSSEQDGPDEGLSLAASNPGDSPLHRRRYPSGDIGRAEETTSTIRHDMNFNEHPGVPDGQAGLPPTFAYGTARSESSFEQDRLSPQHQSHLFNAVDGEHYDDLEHGLESDAGLSFGMFKATLQQDDSKSTATRRYLSLSASSDGQLEEVRHTAHRCETLLASIST